MNVVTELNELAEELTGVNPQCTLDAEAVKYLRENLGGKVELTGDATFIARYFSNPSLYGTLIKITNEDDLEQIEKVDKAVTKNNNIDVIMNLYVEDTKWKFRPYVAINDGAFYGLEIEILKQSLNQTSSIIILKLDNEYYLMPQLYVNSPVSNDVGD